MDKGLLVDKVYQGMREQYDRKCDKIAAKALPQIKHVYETMSNKYKNIVFPLSDGRREMELIVNLEDAYSTQGKIISKSFEKNIILSKIDDEWKEHLREMDDLRSAVNNATYEQKDPLVVYKLESYELFKAMMNRLNEEAVDLLMRMDIPVEQQLKAQIRTKNKVITKNLKRILIVLLPHHFLNFKEDKVFSKQFKIRCRKKKKDSQLL